MERIYPDRERPPLLMGPTVDVLKAFCWKIRCPPKIKHFLWQLVSGCVAVKKNLKARGLQGEICCARCGAEEESINHVFFECPPTCQVWALSKIPTNPAVFPTNSLFYEYGSSFLAGCPADGGSSVRLDTMVYLKRKK